MPSLDWPARILVAIGCGCLTAVGTQFVEAASFQRTSAETFQRTLTAAASAAPSVPLVTPVAPPAAGIDDDASMPDDGVVGLLEVPRLNLSAMVVEGDDTGALAVAAGHVPGTALPWQPGNVVIAGHRDTFFRPLRDLRDGDTIRLTTTRGTFEYHVTRTEVVDPDDVSVLAPTRVRSLTLITCYPFVYIGHAPRRFIVHAH